MDNYEHLDDYDEMYEWLVLDELRVPKRYIRDTENPFES